MIRTPARSWRRTIPHAAVWMLAMAPAACGYAGSGPASMEPASRARPAVSAPSRFEPADPALRLPPADTLAGGGCLTPMVDPRDGVRVVLVRSWRDDGDYEPPEGRYGVAGSELLRLRCNTGALVGVVRR